MPSKISELTNAAALTGTEEMPGTQGGGNVAISASQILSYLLGSADTAELVRDTVAAALVAGTNVTITPNDGANTITIAASGGGGGGGSGPLGNYTASVAPTVNDDTGDGYSVGSRWLIPGTGQTFICTDATAAAAKWVPMGVAEHPGYVSGRYYIPEAMSRGTGAVAANTLYAVPLTLRRSVTIDELGIYVATGVSSTNALFGIYTNVNGAPDALVAQVAAAAPTATSDVGTSAAVSPSVALPAGTYWFACLFDGAPTVNAITAASGALGVSALVGNSGLTLVTKVGTTGVSASQSYASGLPGTFPPASPRGNAITPLPAFKVA